jgi:hypothetical protein
MSASPTPSLEAATQCLDGEDLRHITATQVALSQAWAHAATNAAATGIAASSGRHKKLTSRPTVRRVGRRNREPSCSGEATTIGWRRVSAMSPAHKHPGASRSLSD